MSRQNVEIVEWVTDAFNRRERERERTQVRAQAGQVGHLRP
jgi:hypothetical protein